MLVNGDLAEVIFYCVEDFFNLGFTCLLKEHLAKEICKWMHHELVKRLVFKKQLRKHIFDKLTWVPDPVVSLLLYFFSNFVLQNLASELISCKKIAFLNQEPFTILICRQQIVISESGYQCRFHSVAMAWSGVTWCITRAGHAWTFRRVSSFNLIWPDPDRLGVLPLESLHLLNKNQLRLKSLLLVLDILHLEKILLIYLVWDTELVERLHLLKVLKLLMYGLLLLIICWTLRHLSNKLLMLGLKVKRGRVHLRHVRSHHHIWVLRWKHPCSWLHWLSVISLMTERVLNEMGTTDWLARLLNWLN